MKKSELVENLKQQSQTLRQELVQLQESFNNKKEQLIKVEGALEGLTYLDDDEEPEEDTSTEE